GKDGDENDVSENEVESLRLEANMYSLASHMFWAIWGYIQASQSTIDFDFLATMDDLTTFLNSVESSARKILKQQNKKQQQQAARDRVALIKGLIQAAPETNGTSHTPTREELRVTYASGGSLIIPAPISPAISNQQSISDDGTLPRLPPPRSPVASVPPGSIYSPLQLPAIKRKGKHAPGSNNTPDKRSPALKLLESPLYKSLTKLRADTGGFGSAGTSPGQKLKKTLHDVDNVALLLRKMGLHDATGAASPAHRADHAVDKRMCNACWAKPEKVTGCEHHSRVYPTGKSVKSLEGDALSFLTSMELQGPTSWLSDDLFVKYRSEKDREKLWFAYVELKKQQQEIEARGTANAKEQASLAVIPIVTRHPICALFETLQNLENLRTQAETRKRNLTKTFIFDVNHIWLTNLDHFNHRPERHLDPVEKFLCRRRVEKDLLYVIQNHLTSGPNDPSYFSVIMSHETMADVLGARLSSYLAMIAEREARAAYEKKLYEIEQKLEAGRLALERKRQEQKRLEQELEAAAAQAEARSKGGVNSATEEAIGQEWAQRMAGSIVLEQQGLWEMREITADSSGVVFYHSLNEGLPVSRRFLWEQPEEWEENDDEDSKPSLTKQRVNSEAQAEMMRSLLEDEQFLQQLKAKLGLTSRSRPVSRATARSGRRSLVFEDEEDENDARRVDLNDEVAALEDEAMDRSKSALISAKIAKLQLQLPQTRAKASQPVNHRGEGWKRLKTSRLPPNFARSVYKTHTEGPRSSFINQTNHATPVGMLDPADCSPYDPPEFIPELRAHFVPRPSEDLHEKKRQWAELLRTQQTSGTPTSSAIRRGAVSVEPTDDLFEHDSRPQNESKEQIEARALLCARNNNLEGLELALDQGVDVNARDNHGNTLFILACQQGNKRLAKFLLRRRADMNLQNLNGNTALHYLYAYKHKDLADYLKAKGAKDTTQNAAGLTCYEGLSQDDVDGI
ncbi:hypothetical protein JG687_00010419, partial [Phytophthora cactorum]